MFDEILNDAAKCPKTVAVAAAHDKDVLEAVFSAQERGIVTPILIGDKLKIQKHTGELGIDPGSATIINELSPMRAALCASNMVRKGEADFLMKGLLQTAELLKAVLDKEQGLRSGSLLSHVAIIEAPAYKRPLFLTDSAMIMYPDLRQKVELINNSVVVAKSLGVNLPKVAVISAVEMVNPDMQSTLDAAILSQMNRRGQIAGCIVDGPLALDNALDLGKAQHKGVMGSEVAGQADILLAPNIETANGIYKTATCLAFCQAAGLIVGAKAPIILTSRADSARSKLLSIVCAARMASYLSAG